MLMQSIGSSHVNMSTSCFDLYLCLRVVGAPEIDHSLPCRQQRSPSVFLLSLLVLSSQAPIAATGVIGRHPYGSAVQSSDVIKWLVHITSCTNYIMLLYDFKIVFTSSTQASPQILLATSRRDIARPGWPCPHARPPPEPSSRPRASARSGARPCSPSSSRSSSCPGSG
jgi:hypothetical protein